MAALQRRIMGTLYFEDVKFWCPNEYDGHFIEKGATRTIVKLETFRQATDMKHYWFRDNSKIVKILGDIDGAAVFIKYGISPNELSNKQWANKKNG